MGTPSLRLLLLCLPCFSVLVGVLLRRRWLRWWCQLRWWQLLAHRVSGRHRSAWLRLLALLWLFWLLLLPLRLEGRLA